MIYSKQPLDFKAQIDKLQKRGLRFDNIGDAELKLSSISYYRLRAYTYPFQDNTSKDHPFIVDVSFENIFELYKFDHRLRVLVFDILGIIEVAFRTQIIYNFALTYGSHWQSDPGLFRNPLKFANHLNSLQIEMNRSNECFIDHYANKYDSPEIPPSWMSLEVSSFGLLSKIFQNLKRCNEKRNIIRYFGVKDESVLESWMLSFCNMRNICAHHSRLWNRRLTAKPQLPDKPIYLFAQSAKTAPVNKLYPTLCCVFYVLEIIRPNNNYKHQLKKLILSCPLDQQKEMGFPREWQSDPFWN